MLYFEGYGIQLKRLELQDIELVRYWRNSVHIRRFMEFRDEITPEMQLSWFNSIHPIRDYFFLISVKGKYIGLINGSDTDWEKGITGNGGIFVWEEDFWSTSIPFAAALLLTEFSFNFGIRKSFVKILSDNNRSIQFNSALGYRLLPDQENVTNQKYVLEHDVFFETTKQARMQLSRIYNSDLIFRILGIPDDAEKFLLNQYQKSKAEMISTIQLTIQ